MEITRAALYVVGIREQVLRFCSMPRYDITVGDTFARIPIITSLMDHDVDMFTYPDITMI